MVGTGLLKNYSFQKLKTSAVKKYNMLISTFQIASQLYLKLPQQQFSFD